MIYEAESLYIKKTKWGPYLNELNLTLVGPPGAMKQGPSLIQVCFQLQALVVQDRELWLHAAVFRGLLHHFFHSAPQLHLRRTQGRKSEAVSVP